ncbi:unnamed protein product [Arabis nemorensis]|uniref:C2H2-type domain-containing protein n=1 Tax=Arabis nemorensis TaxID=586526 RepID=A0A565C5Q9_9BRAS|nr:unnamed protein product [Arabis nemorensis]
MDKSKENKYVCKFCNKEFPSGKSLGGHIRTHSNEYSVASHSYNAKNNKRLVDQREKKQLCCRECGKGFHSHMDCHSEREKKIVMSMYNQFDTETSSSPTRKRSNKVMKRSNSESFTNGSSSTASEIDQEDKDGALSLVIMSRESSFKKGHDLVVNSLAESSDNNSVIVETKPSSGEQLKMFNVKNQADKVALDDQLRSVDDDNGVTTCDSDGSDSDYFMNGPKKSESDISVDVSLKNTGFNRFRKSGVKEGGSKYELMSKSKRVFPSHETDSYADTNSKIHRSSDNKSPMDKKASSTKKKSKSHECPFCFRVFKSGQALGGHKRSHSIGNQVAEMRNLFDLNIPALDTDESIRI